MIDPSRRPSGNERKIRNERFRANVVHDKLVAEIACGPRNVIRVGSLEMLSGDKLVSLIVEKRGFTCGKLAIDVTRAREVLDALREAIEAAESKTSRGY